MMRREEKVERQIYYAALILGKGQLNLKIYGEIFLEALSTGCFKREDVNGVSLHLALYY